MWQRITTHRLRAAFAAGVLLGLGILVFVAAQDQRTVVQSTGVLVIAPVAGLAPGDRACQTPIVTFDAARVVGFHPRGGPATPALEVTVRSSTNWAVLATGRVPAGFTPGPPVQARLDRVVPAERSVALCVENVGTTPIILFGDDGKTDICTVLPKSLACRFRLPHPISSTSRALLNGDPLSGTMSFSLSRDEPQSVLSQVGDIAQRASSFRPGFVSPTLYWLLLVGVVVICPASILLAIRSIRPTDVDQA